MVFISYGFYVEFCDKAKEPGTGKPISKVIGESVGVWAFIMDQLGMK